MPITREQCAELEDYEQCRACAHHFAHNGKCDICLAGQADGVPSNWEPKEDE